MGGISTAGLDKLLARFASLRIAVLGDLALDCYWTVDPAAAVPSVETGKPTRPVREQRYAPGAAGNVACNLNALGCEQVSVFGIVGPDPWGAELRRQLARPGIDTTAILVQEDDWFTTAYVKPHVNGEEQNRLDFGDFNRLADASTDALLSRLSAALAAVDTVIINAQARAGIHTPYLREQLSRLVAANPNHSFVVDSRAPETMYPGCVLKLNREEAARCCNRNSDATTLAAALFARRRQPVFVTDGAAGIAAHDAAGPATAAGLPAPAELDPTGAGDAALAGLTAALAAGGTAAEAAAIGNLAAAVTIRKLQQTGTATIAEIRQLAAETTT
jgi:rfaE bifunctional protein kinase chain/domain